jgi:flagella basal body P-ring formation protein FlgA
MATETQPETPAQPAPTVASQEPAPTQAEAPAPAPIDVEQLLAAERARLQAEREQAVAAAREEAIAAERARLAEEQRQAAMTEAEREAEKVRLADVERKRLASELESAQARESAKAREADEAARQLAFAEALTDSDVRLVRGANGTIDPGLRKLAFERAEALAKTGLSHADALAELAKTQPWMFAPAAGAAAAQNTNTGSPGVLGRPLEPPRPRKLDPINNDDDYREALNLIHLSQSGRRTP